MDHKQIAGYVFLIASLVIFEVMEVKGQFDVQGHRGCRGLMPENSIPAFIKAVELGVTTLEMDVVITSDKKVIVSHEPYISSAICNSDTGLVISKSNERSFNIYKMTAQEVRSFDCGSSGNKKFPGQQKTPVVKPLLSEVIVEVEAYISEHKLKPVRYNIEIKSSSKRDSLYHPSPEEFSELVIGVLKEYGILDKCVIQSFDIRPLQYIHQKYPELELALLTAKIGNYDKFFDELGFVPGIYSPYYRLLSKKKINRLHDSGVKVIPWTVNREKDMLKFIRFGVDGIITDYPDLLLKLVADNS